MQKNYIKDEAVAYYEQLMQLIDTQTAARDRYLLLRDLFRRLVDQAVIDEPINVAGLFGKVDYLVKKCNIPRKHSRLIHDTRHSLNDMGRKTEDELAASMMHDVKAVAIFVSYIFPDTPIPASLYSRLPFENRETKWRKFNENCIRAIVSQWDDDYITVTEEQNDSELKVCYSKKNKYLTRSGVHDWSYLRQILSEGASLNLVRVRMEDGICMPELIIFEPDYLINVTTITSCFETYAESPYVNLLNKFKPSPNTNHIHLGNLAGQYLDHTVHHRDISYADSWNEYLRSNAIGILSCDEILTRKGYEDFRNVAERQQENINHLIGEDLMHIPGIDDFDAKDIILEPTFFSEVLGIQGRLDFLWETRDVDHAKRKTIIIEQKSGKGESVWPPVQGMDPNVPVARLQHWLQLILYRALFQYEFQKFSDSFAGVMLLYSKYSKGLISQGHSPELMLRAIQMRNLLAWCEMKYADKGMPELLRITPDMMRRKTVSDKFWKDYIKGQLAEITDPIQSASPLEQAYFLRFLRFLEREQLLSKIGNKEKEDSGFASKWHDSLEDKKASGNIYDGLIISDYGLSEDETAVESVRLKFGVRPEADTSNFRRGDIIVLYDYREGEVPNACAQMVHRASITDIAEDSIEVQLRNSQTDRHVFLKPQGTLWAIEHDLFDSTSGSLYSAMHSFLCATRERRDLVLSQRLPEVDTSLNIKGEYSAFNTLVTRAKQARELFLIIGPPGTGKTSFGMLNQVKEELLEPGANILITSFTNRAVDEICSKLIEEGIDFIRIGSPLTASEECHPYLLSDRVRQCTSGGDMMALFRNTRVFCATTASLNANIHLFKIKHFDLAIVDEASQILEPHLIGLLSARHGDQNAISRFVFIGDHKQLPAVVQQSADESLVTEPELRAIGLTDCRLSLFERLLTRFRTPEGYDPRFVYMLTRQGRMHQDIAEFPNLAFYGGKLQVVPLPHQIVNTKYELRNTKCELRDTNYELRNANCEEPPAQSISDFGFRISDLLLNTRVSFIASESPHLSTSFKTNEVEAEMIAKLVVEIYRQNQTTFDVNNTIGIIVPYRNQISTIRNAIDRIAPTPVLHDITIDTVERYQGSQRDYIIYGFTIQQRYQLNFLTNNTFEEDGLIIDRKLNVAMTRARLHLIMIGNPSLLRENYTFHALMEFVRKKGGYYDKLMT